MDARRKFALIGLLIAAVLIVAAFVFDDRPQVPEHNAAANLVAAHRACEAETGHRCD